MRNFNTLFSLFIVAVASGFSFLSCNVINPAEKVPTYVHVDSFKLQNSPISNITAVWVYYNNNPIGIFDLPATFPVMAEGTGTIQMDPVIAVDGQNNQMQPYPFYTLDSFNLVANRGKIITHNPTTTYYSSAKITDISNFTGGQVNFTLWGGNIPMVAVNADSLVFEGGWSGAIFLNAVGDSSIDSTNETFSIPAGQPAFLEITYNTTVPFYLGLQARYANLIETNNYFLVGVKPNNKWQKFYFNLQSFATEYQGTSYNFFIKAVLQPGQTSGRLLLDNIKVVTF